MYSYIIAVRYTMNFDLTEEAKKQLDYMIARRRYLHRHPCVSFHEEDTLAYALMMYWQIYQNESK